MFRLTDCSFVLPASSGRLRLRLVVWNVPICSCVSRKRTHNGAKPRLRRCTSPRPHTTRTHTARSAAPCAALWHAARLFAAAATTCRRHAQPHASNAKKCMLMHMPQADGGTHARVPSHVSSPRRPPDMVVHAWYLLRCVEHTHTPALFASHSLPLWPQLHAVLQYYLQFACHLNSIPTIATYVYLCRLHIYIHSMDSLQVRNLAGCAYMLLCAISPVAYIHCAALPVVRLLTMCNLAGCSFARDTQPCRLQFLIVWLCRLHAR